MKTRHSLVKMIANSRVHFPQAEPRLSRPNSLDLPAAAAGGAGALAAEEGAESSDNSVSSENPVIGMYIVLTH